jgi:hypothetical protein
MSQHPTETARQVNVLIHRARGHLERGQPGEAMKLFHQVLQLEPNHAHVQQWVAKLRGRMKKPAGVAAASAPAQAAPAKLNDETLLSAVKTDVYPAGYGGQAAALRKAPARPRTKRPESTGEPSGPEMETTVPGRVPGSLDRTAPLISPAPKPPGPPAAKRPAAQPVHGERLARPMAASRPVRSSRTEAAGSSLAPPPLDTSDADVALLLGGAALGGVKQRFGGPIAFLGAAVLIGLCLIAFYRHSGTYLVKLDPGALEVSIQQGAFFFTGWNDARKVSLGYDAAWPQRLGQPELIEELRQGKAFGSGPEVDAFIVSLFVRLGRQAMLHNDSSKLLEAVYYLKQGHRLYERSDPKPPEEQQVRQSLVEALLRFADYRIERGELAQARDTLSQVRRYDPASAGLAERLARLERPPEAQPDPAPKGSRKSKKQSRSGVN